MRPTNVAILLVLAVSAAAEEPGGWPALKRYEAMAVPADNPMTRSKVELGKQLFFDKRLSGDSSAACIACHRPDRGLTDGRRDPVGAYGKAVGRACPTLWNVGYQQAFFWEGSATSLEQAVAGVWKYNLVPQGPGRPTPDDVVARLNAIPGYRRAFDAAFGEPATLTNVPKALASFLRTLVADRSAWVRFQDGDSSALGPQARRGFALFDGKARCTQCHNGLLLTDLQFHNVGIGSRAEKPDPGRFAITGVEANRSAFKTPTLLNVGRSAPYFHDGSVATLEEAVEIMAGGGIPNPHLDAALRPVALTSGERADLLAFLRALDVDVQATEPVLPPEEPTTALRLTGEIVDMHCYLARGERGPGHAGCANACIGRGVTPGFVAEDGRVFLLLGERPFPVKDVVAGLAGQRVTVEGRVVERDGVRGFQLGRVDR